MAATMEPSKEDDEKTLDYASNSSSKEPRGSLFAIYKKGQGYWTRMGTAFGASVLLGLTLVFLYRDLIPYFSLDTTLQSWFGATNTAWRLIVCAAVTIAGVLLVWWLMNGPKRAQFLIDTDSEMKKVNWASRNELFASTKVVIFFMLLIALALFIFDQQFHGLFFALGAFHVPLNYDLLPATGIIFTGVAGLVGFLVMKSAEDQRPKFWGTMLMGIGIVGFVAWASWWSYLRLNPPTATPAAPPAAVASGS
jgi:preprotein translocase subunit SecE